MSELLRKYYSIVVEPEKDWLYFDIPGCLEKLPWSLGQCYAHISPHWLDGSSFTRHAIVQLALYTCYPFCEAPPEGYRRRTDPNGYIIDLYHQKDQKTRQNRIPCHSPIGLIEELATDVMGYEASCEYSYGWPRFEAEREMVVKFLKTNRWLWNNLRQQKITPERAGLQNHRMFASNLQEMIGDLLLITEQDYKNGKGPTNHPRHPIGRALRWGLIDSMYETFKTYVPTKRSDSAIYRALAAIMTQLGIHHGKGPQWEPDAVKTFLRRGPSGREKPPGQNSPEIWCTTRDHPQPCGTIAPIPFGAMPMPPLTSKNRAVKIWFMRVK
jgi:hypothetical protein